MFGREILANTTINRRDTYYKAIEQSQEFQKKQNLRIRMKKNLRKTNMRKHKFVGVCIQTKKKYRKNSAISLAVSLVYYFHLLSYSFVNKLIIH